MISNPYARNAATTGITARLPTDLSQNMEIAALSKAVSDLKLEVAQLTAQLADKADKDEVTAIVAWDLSDAARRNTPPVIMLCGMILAIIGKSIVDFIIRDGGTLATIAAAVANQAQNNAPSSSSAQSTVKMILPWPL